MSNKLNELGQNCEQLIDGIQDAISWANHYLSREQGKVDLIAQLKTHRRKSRRLARSASLRSATAVFGASQHGKSYLISNMLRGGSRNNMEVYLPEPNLDGYSRVDFNDHINPDGGQESTGAVTRFTTANPEGLSGFSGVQLELLGQAEIAAILSAGFVANVTFDNEQGWPTPTIDRDQLQQAFYRAKSQASTKECEGLSEDDIYDLKEFIERNFNTQGLILDLERLGYWDDLADVAPKVDLENSWPLFEFLWYGVDSVTDVFKKLCRGLKALDFSRYAAVGEDALVPKTVNVDHVTEPNSIIDVNVVGGIAESQDRLTAIQIRSASRSATLPRSVVTGITKEIVLRIPSEISEQPGQEFLKHSDVFDFPGARNTKSIPRAKFEPDHPDFAIEMKEMFVRGKVSFLFERYDQEYRIGSLVVCQKDGNFESDAAAKLSYRWVSKNIGSSPEARAHSKNLFFMAFTFWNNELEKTAPSIQAHNSKWAARLDKNFREEWERIQPNDKWISEWTPNQSFNNTYFIRDPKFSLGIFDSKDGQETGVRSDQEESLHLMRESFCQSHLVEQFVSFPAKTWEGSAIPNASGALHLLEALTRSTSPDDKLSQIRAEYSRVLKGTHASLRSFYHGGDKDKEIERAKMEGAQAGHALWQMLTRKGTFGIFLDSLYATQDLTWKVYYEVSNPVLHTPSEEEQVSAAGITTGIDETTAGLIFGGWMPQEEVTATQAKPQDDFLNRPEAFATSLLEKWFGRLSQISEDTATLGKVGLDEDKSLLIIKALKESATRHGLSEKIQGMVADGLNNSRKDDVIDRYSAMATQALNDFISTLGWHYIAEDHRPTIVLPNSKKEVALFTSSRPKKPRLDELIGDENTAGQEFALFWIQGIYNAFLANATNVSYDIEANRLLGQVIDTIPAPEK